MEKSILARFRELDEQLGRVEHELRAARVALDDIASSMGFTRPRDNEITETGHAWPVHDGTQPINRVGL